MFCPNCGATNSTDQNYCRACGLQLGEISSALLVQVPSASADKLERRTAAIDKVGRASLYGLAGVATVGSAAVMYFVITRFILSGVNIPGGIFILLFWLFGSISFAYLFYKRSLMNRQKRLRYQAPRVVTDELYTAQLSDADLSPPSIAEGTTRHLK